MHTEHPEPEFARQLREDMAPDDVGHILAIFALDLETLSEAVAHAAASGQTEALRRAAHALSGAAGAVGATDLDAACRAAMQTPDPAPLDAQAHRIAACVQRARSALTRVQATLPNS